MIKVSKLWPASESMLWCDWPWVAFSSSLRDCALAEATALAASTNLSRCLLPVCEAYLEKSQLNQSKTFATLYVSLQSIFYLDFWCVEFWLKKPWLTPTILTISRRNQCQWGFFTKLNVNVSGQCQWFMEPKPMSVSFISVKVNTIEFCHYGHFLVHTWTEIKFNKTWVYRNPRLPWERPL